MQPLLKWPGGKRRIVTQLAAAVGVIPDNGRYLELFGGSGALLFHMKPARAVLVDTCKPLISFYEAIQREPQAFYDETCKLLELPFCEETYNAIKADWSGHDFGVKCAARLLYMNKLGFNGLFRLNRKLGYNVAWGKKAKMPAFPTLLDVQEASQVLNNTKLYNKDYSVILRSAHQGDVVYADPPYWNTYDRYSGEGFSNEDHRQLAIALHEAAGRGVKIVASNIDCEDVRTLYSWADIDIIPVLHKISRKSETRRVVQEVIIRSREDQKQMGLFDECPDQTP